MPGTVPGAVTGRQEHPAGRGARPENGTLDGSDPEKPSGAQKNNFSLCLFDYGGKIHTK